MLIFGRTFPFGYPSTMLLPLLAAVAFQGGLKKTDVVIGKGPAAKAGDYVIVDYTGKLTNGKQFDSSIGRGPFTFHLGAGQVIKGWDQGVAGMKAGGKRKLVIPGSMGYGASGTPDGSIPPNATLVFDVTLISIPRVGITTLKKGAGASAKAGDSVSIDYTGSLKSTGKVFDSSKGKNPIDFRIGSGVIPGFSMGVTGMKLGEKRKVVIPSALGYGANGAGGVIPPNADLIFEIELVGLNGRKK